LFDLESSGLFLGVLCLGFAFFCLVA
jgi:hypothetical protein